MSMPPKSVLFACRHNSIRSPMAAAIARSLAPYLRIASGGVAAGEPDPFATAVMAEIGLDLSSHHPIAFADVAPDAFDMIVTLDPQAHHLAMELTRDGGVTVEYWPTFDPTAVEGNREQVLDAYRVVRDGLLQKIRGRLARS